MVFRYLNVLLFGFQLLTDTASTTATTTATVSVRRLRGVLWLKAIGCGGGQFHL